MKFHHAAATARKGHGEDVVNASLKGSQLGLEVTTSRQRDDRHSAALPCGVRDAFQDAATGAVHIDDDHMGLPVSKCRCGVFDRWGETRVVMAMTQRQFNDVGEHALFNDKQRASRPAQPLILRHHDVSTQHDHGDYDIRFASMLPYHRPFRTSASASARWTDGWVALVLTRCGPRMTKLHDIAGRLHDSIVRSHASCAPIIRLAISVTRRSRGGTRSVSANEALVRRAIAAIWNRGDLDVADELFAADYVNHNGLIMDLVRGPEAMKISAALYRVAFPGLHVKVAAVSTIGDTVVLRWIAISALNRRGGGAPPSPSRSLTGITHCRVADGKILETWTEWDRIGVMGELGFLAGRLRTRPDLRVTLLLQDDMHGRLRKNRWLLSLRLSLRRPQKSQFEPIGANSLDDGSD
jgi:hypothetical protein